MFIKVEKWDYVGLGVFVSCKALDVEEEDGRRFVFKVNEVAVSIEQEWESREGHCCKNVLPIKQESQFPQRHERVQFITPAPMRVADCFSPST